MRKAHQFIVAIAATAASSLVKAATVVVGSTAFGPAATLLTFENGLPLGNAVTFVSTSPDSTPWFAASSSPTGFFGALGVANLGGTRYSDIAVEFASSQGMVGAWVGNIPNFTQSSVSSLTVEVFDRQATSLGSFQVAMPSGAGNNVFFGLSSTEGISRIEWRGGNAGFFGLDNLKFQAQPVPEPHIGLMFLAGLATLGAWRARAGRHAGGAAA